MAKVMLSPALQILGSYSDGLCLYFLDLLCTTEGVRESCINEVAISFLRKTSSGSIHSKMGIFPLLIYLLFLTFFFLLNLEFVPLSPFK